MSSEKQGLECVGGSMPSIDETVSVDLGERECGMTIEDCHENDNECRRTNRCVRQRKYVREIVVKLGEHIPVRVPVDGTHNVVHFRSARSVKTYYERAVLWISAGRHARNADSASQ